MLPCPKKITADNLLGFTLVELMLVVGIIAIVTGALIPSFSGYIKTQNLKQAQENVRSELRSAQNRALTGSLSDTYVGSDRVKYWVFYTTANSSSYSFYTSAQNTSCNPANFSAAHSTQTLTNGITFNISAAKCIFFDMSDGSINAVPASPLSVSVWAGSGASKTVSFNSAGLIY